MNSQIGDIYSPQQDDKDGIIALYSGVTGNTSNTASQTDSTSGVGGGWVPPLLAFAALRRRDARK
jgi:hypothetical protein